MFAMLPACRLELVRQSRRIECSRVTLMTEDSVGSTLTSRFESKTKVPYPSVQSTSAPHRLMWHGALHERRIL